MDHKITNEYQFITAGNATFTALSNKTNKRYTFKVVDLHRIDPKNPAGEAFFVKFLYGPDNTRDYKYLGLLNTTKREPVVYPSKKSPMVEVVKAFQWVVKMAKANMLGDKVTIFHEGRCGRCGRKLTVPESIESGFGPECINHI